MSDFDPGEGWIPANRLQWASTGGLQLWEDERNLFWVRKEPVPPLPIEPYTVIRVTWAAAKEPGVLTLAAANRWVSFGGDGYRPEFVANQISGFEVLAEPRPQHDTDWQVFERKTRRDTARAVIEFVEKHMGTNWDTFRMARSEFGVES